MIAPASTIRKRLRLRHLPLMTALSETESLRSAADELAMTQPAATKALKELEDTIGVSLFVRHARGMEPTIFGEAVMRYARVVFEDLDELRDELAAIEAGDIGKVRIGAVMAPAPELLTHAIVALKAAHPRLLENRIDQDAGACLRVGQQIGIGRGLRVEHLAKNDHDRYSVVFSATRQERGVRKTKG